jgi:YVTN family beta-propeller protein
MSRSCTRFLLACVLPSVLAPLSVAAESGPRFQLTGHIAGPDGLWDYASVDAPARRLYVAKAGGIMAVDLTTGAVTPKLFASPVVHQVLPIGGAHLLATTGDSNKVVLLDGVTGKVIATIPTGDEPDSVAYDAKTGRAITFNRRGHDTTIFDVAKATVVGGFKLPGKPEFAVADGNGIVYVNIADRSQIAVIDVAKGAITRTIALTGCDEPTGLALDTVAGLLLSACDNGIAKVVTTQGKEVASLTIGKAPDAAFIDTRRRLAFIPGGDDGSLTVISLADPAKVSVVQRVLSKRSARTGAVDPDTGTVYLPAGRLIPAVAPAKWPTVVPGSFEILVVTR